MNPIAVGISGGSCSGKSTLAKSLFKTLGAENSVILPQDDYFFGLGDAPSGKGGPNFDHPNAVNFDAMCAQLAQIKAGETIHRPLYDFPTHLPKKETQRTEPRPVILVDGILILHHLPMRALLDLTIFVECDAATRLSRRMKRDVKERGRTAASVKTVFADQVAPMHDKYVEPSKVHADILVDSHFSDHSFERHVGKIGNRIKSLCR